MLILVVGQDLSVDETEDVESGAFFFLFYLFQR